MGIRSIRHKGLRRLYERGDRRDLPAAQAEKISDILLAIDEATQPQDVGLFPGWRLHPLGILERDGQRKLAGDLSVRGRRRVRSRFRRLQLSEVFEFMAMKNPPHVGGLIRRQIIEPLGLSVTEAAKVLGVGRQALSSLLNGKTALTSNMGLRVEKAFGPKMEHLMRMQLAFDLAQARNAEHDVRVKRYVSKRTGTVRQASARNGSTASTA